MENFKYGTTEIQYSISYKSNQKDVSLSVDLKNGVQVVAPEGLSEEKLHTIMLMKAPWIIRKKNELAEVAVSPFPKEFVSGEKFAYLGRHYKLKVHKNDNIRKPSLVFKQGKFISEVPKGYTDEEKKQKLQLLFKEWYIKHGKNKVEERSEIYCPKMGLEPTSIKIKEQQKRWGTCTKEGAIYLNWRIIMAPMSIIDYVLVHELAHLKYPDHSNEYWRFIRSILPDYEQRKEWLRVNGPLLALY